MVPSHLLVRTFNILRPWQNGRHFPDDIFKCIFLNENVWISIKISLNFVPLGPINNIPALVQIMAWRRPGDKPLSEPIMVCLLTHICVTRSQWVKKSYNSVYVLGKIHSYIKEGNAGHENDNVHVCTINVYIYISIFWTLMTMLFVMIYMCIYIHGRIYDVFSNKLFLAFSQREHTLCFRTFLITGIVCTDSRIVFPDIRSFAWLG